MLWNLRNTPLIAGDNDIAVGVRKSRFGRELAIIVRYNVRLLCVSPIV